MNKRMYKYERGFFFSCGGNPPDSKGHSKNNPSGERAMEAEEE